MVLFYNGQKDNIFLILKNINEKFLIIINYIFIFANFILNLMFFFHFSLFYLSKIFDIDFFKSIIIKIIFDIHVYLESWKIYLYILLLFIKNLK